MLGFTPTQFIESLEWAEAETNDHMKTSISEVKAAYAQARLTHQVFNQWSKGKEEQYTSVEELITAFSNDHPQVNQVIGRFYDALSLVAKEDQFAVVPRNDAERKVFDSISMEFGDNVRFWEELSNYKGWPLNSSMIHRKPVIRHGGKYFFFHIPLILRSVTELLALVAVDKAGTSLESKLLKRRDDYLEEKSIELLSATLGKCSQFRNLYYPSDFGQGWLETDGLVMYGDTLVVAEAKAGRLSPAAWRGALKSFNTGLKDIVGVAHKQGLNVLTYLKANESAQFYDERRQPKVTVKLSDFNRVFVINLTLEQLGTVATHISSMSDLGIIKQKEWPWVVNLNDLRAISEIIEHPTEFIHYLTRRLQANDIVQLRLFNELDFFMLYPESTEGRPWGQPLKKPAGAALNLG